MHSRQNALTKFVPIQQNIATTKDYIPSINMVLFDKRLISSLSYLSKNIPVPATYILVYSPIKMQSYNAHNIVC